MIKKRKKRTVAQKKVKRGCETYNFFFGGGEGVVLGPKHEISVPACRRLFTYLFL
jgi:hypothetical protein